MNLKFDKFELAKPCGADFVEVSDVTADDTRSRGKYCGNFPDTTSAGEEVDVRFVSNSQGREKGFVIKYEAVNRGKNLEINEERNKLRKVRSVLGPSGPSSQGLSRFPWHEALD